MSEDQSVSVENPEVVEQVEQPEVTQAPDADEMRKVLFGTLTDVYAALMGVMNKLPLHQQIKQNAITRMDEGLLWAREGISMINFAPPSNPIEAPAPEGGLEPTPENVAVQDAA